MTVILELSRAGAFFASVSFDSAGSSPAGDLRWSFSAILSEAGISVCCSALHVTALGAVREGSQSDARIGRVAGCSLGAL